MIGAVLCFFGRHAWRQEPMFRVTAASCSVPTWWRCRRCGAVKSVG